MTTKSGNKSPGSSTQVIEESPTLFIRSADVNAPPKSLSISSSKQAGALETWEDEADASDAPALSPVGATPPLSPAQPGPPPPTPLSPSCRLSRGTDWSNFPQVSTSKDKPSAISNQTEGSSKRPEKSSAAAGRMIAGALGVRGPKMTEEQKKYESAVREKEKKRIEKEKEEGRRREKEKEEAKKAVWDD